MLEGKNFDCRIYANSIGKMNVKSIFKIFYLDKQIEIPEDSWIAFNFSYENIDEIKKLVRDLSYVVSFLEKEEYYDIRKI